jgi:hypothetical protein
MRGIVSKRKEAGRFSVVAWVGEQQSLAYEAQVTVQSDGVLAHGGDTAHPPGQCTHA